jgi:hypothetical protein
MKLTTPTKTTEGFKIGFSTKALAPELQYDGTKWILTTEWMTAISAIRTKVLALLFESRNTLFKNSPTMKTLENLMKPWVTVDSSGNYIAQYELPLPSTKEGAGILDLSGIFIKRDGIMPIWRVDSYTENTPVVDFDWGNEETPENDLREVTLIESEVPSDNSNVIHLNTDEEYNARKFAAKERVKEARLKAILARRAAEVETNRYYNEFNFGENESTFSEYDISDMDDSEGEESAQEAD